jgi:hypothetical protein
VNEPRRKFIYAPVSPDEHRMILARAAAENVSVAEWMRRAVNRELFATDDEAPLVRELGEGRRRQQAAGGSVNLAPVSTGRSPVAGMVAGAPIRRRFP